MADATSIKERIEQLGSVPTRIAAATHGASEATLHLRTAEEPWSVNDVLAHVRAAADNRMRFMRRMASGKSEKLTYLSARSELKRTDYVDLPFSENLAAFTADRLALVVWLATLPAEAWERKVSIRDRPETVASYARYLTEHDLGHCDQIEALLR